jgi:phosphatidylinositol-3-phosphatase
VFVIMLSRQPYASVFGPGSAAPYLTRTLERRGALLVHYDAVAHEQLANEIALISGQGPTLETAANCPSYNMIAPATLAANEQVLGDGCVYPSSTQTLAGQLTAKHLSWRAYIEDATQAGATPASPCAHPVLGQSDPTATPPASGEAYASFRNPFLYFRALTDAPACAEAPLERLGADLASVRRTPSFSYIAPNLCHDGSPTPCAPGAAAGMAPADALLKRLVPQILRSQAYRQSGLLVITVDEAPSGGELGDSSACCGQPRFPNLPAPAGGLSPRGGGAVGALLLSPGVKGASSSEEPYNHFSLLRTIEDLFGLAHLGYAGLPQVKPLPASILASAPHG